MLDEPLPLRVVPHLEESGLGFCLRALTGNGLNLHWMRRQVGIGEARAITAERAPALAALLQCNTEWLQQSLPRPVRSSDALFRSHHLQSRNQLRWMRPQICTKCVHRDGFCSAAWELSLITACPRHGCPLTDECQACGKPLSWDRPGVAICKCGRPLRTREHAEVRNMGLLADLLAKKLYGVAHSANEWTAAGLPEFLHALSLNGILMVFRAFGVNTREYQRAAASETAKARSTVAWSDLTLRAHDRLARTDALGTSRWSELAPWVCQSTLASFIKRSTEPADYAAAVHLMNCIFGAKESRRMRRDVLQLDLF